MGETMQSMNSGRTARKASWHSGRCLTAVVLAMLAAALPLEVGAQDPGSSREKAQEPAPVSPASVATTNRFDGDWTIRVECPADSSGAPGRAYDFPASILNGHLFGSRGPQGAPGSVQVEGNIGPDGEGRFQAHGRTGGPEDAGPRVAPGTAYSYDIEAHFDDAKGAGRRLQDSACLLTFARR
jgi:hypothetical protein